MTPSESAEAPDADDSEGDAARKAPAAASGCAAPVRVEAPPARSGIDWRESALSVEGKSGQERTALRRRGESGPVAGPMTRFGSRGMRRDFTVIILIATIIMLIVVTDIDIVPWFV